MKGAHCYIRMKPPITKRYELEWNSVGGYQRDYYRICDMLLVPSQRTKWPVMSCDARPLGLRKVDAGRLRQEGLGAQAMVEHK